MDFSDDRIRIWINFKVTGRRDITTRGPTRVGEDAFCRLAISPTSPCLDLFISYAQSSCRVGLVSSLSFSSLPSLIEFYNRDILL
jgi:hypothetical protein